MNLLNWYEGDQVAVENTSIGTVMKHAPTQIWIQDESSQTAKHRLPCYCKMITIIQKN